MLEEVIGIFTSLGVGEQEHPPAPAQRGSQQMRLAFFGQVRDNHDIAIEPAYPIRLERTLANR